MALNYKDAMAALGKRESVWWDGNALLVRGPGDTVKVYYGGQSKKMTLQWDCHWATLHPSGAVTAHYHNMFACAASQWFPKHFGGVCYHKKDRRATAQAWLRMHHMREVAPFAGDVTVQPDGTYVTKPNVRSVLNLERRKPVLAAWQRWRDFAGTMRAVDTDCTVINALLPRVDTWGLEPEYDADVFAEPSVQELAKLSRLRNRARGYTRYNTHTVLKTELKKWLERMYVKHGCMDEFVDDYREAA